MPVIIPKLSWPNWSNLMNDSLNTVGIRLRCHLIDEPFAVNSATSLSDLASLEASFAGYSPQTVLGWVDFGYTPANHLIEQADEVSFTLTSGAADIYGYYLTDPTDTLLYLAEVDPSGPVALNLGNPTYTLRNRYEWSNAPVPPAVPNTIPGLVSWGQPHVSALTSTGAFFSRSAPSALNRYLSHATSADFETGAGVDFTIAVYMRISEDTTFKYAAGKGATGNYEWALDVNSATLRLDVYDATAGSQATATWGTPLVVGQWYCVVAWRDSGSGAINLSVDDAAPVTVSTALPSTAGTAAFRIGTSDTGPSALTFQGGMRAFAYYRRALTSPERTTYFNGGDPLLSDDLSGSMLTDLKLWLDMDTVPNLTSDKSGNANDVVNTNGVILGPGVSETACTDGKPATNIPDMSGSGNPFLMIAPEDTDDLSFNGAPIWKPAVQNSKAMLLGNVAGTGIQCDTLAATFSGIDKPFSFFAAIKGVDTSGGPGANEQVLFMLSQLIGTITPTHDLYYRPTSADWQSDRRDDAATEESAHGGVVDANPHILGVTFDGTLGKVWLDGLIVGRIAMGTGVAMTVNALTLMSHRRFGTLSGAHSFPWGAYMGEFTIYDHGLTNFQAAGLAAYFREQWLTP